MKTIDHYLHNHSEFVETLGKDVHLYAYRGYLITIAPEVMGYDVNIYQESGDGKSIELLRSCGIFHARGVARTLTENWLDAQIAGNGRLAIFSHWLDANRENFRTCFNCGWFYDKTLGGCCCGGSDDPARDEIAKDAEILEYLTAVHGDEITPEMMIEHYPGN